MKCITSFTLPNPSILVCLSVEVGILLKQMPAALTVCLLKLNVNTSFYDVNKIFFLPHAVHAFLRFICVVKYSN